MTRRAALVVALALAAAPGTRADAEREVDDAAVDAAEDDDGPLYDVHLQPQVSVALEYDTNATRVPSGVLGGDPHADPNGPPVVGDALVRAQAALAARAERPGLRLSSDVALGGKLFAQQAAERMAVLQGRAALDAALPFGFTSTLAGFVKARGQATGARTYALARADVGLARRAFGPVTLHGGLSASAFHAFDAPIFTSMGDDVSLGASTAITDAEHVDVTGAMGFRAFPLALPAPLDPAVQVSTSGRRLDAPLSVQATFTSARRVFLSTSYLFERSFSNSRGESFYRHRLSGLVGFRLPERVTTTMRGTLQLTSYDQGVSLGQRYFLGEDEESQNNVELMVTRPWIGGIVVEGRVFWMGNELANEGARFSRATASIGVRADL